MKIDNLISPVPADFPRGLQRVAAVSNRWLATRKGQAALSQFPHAEARCRSRYSHRNTVFPARIAIQAGFPVVQFAYLQIP